MTTHKPFWEIKKLHELSPDEWESLCDGCAKCCLNKLEDFETKTVFYTNVHCYLLDTEQCQCSQYKTRSTLVPECITLTIKDLEDPYWLPSTCAYKRLAEGKNLPDWHPLITGNMDSVVQSGNGICGRTIRETDIKEEDLEQHLITWVHV